MSSSRSKHIRRLLGGTLSAIMLLPAAAIGKKVPEGWWNAAWPYRQDVIIQTGAGAAEINTPVRDTTVLVRLHDGNFNFATCAADASDLRFISPDGDPLPHRIERIDSLLNEAFVWVRVPEILPGGETRLRLYHGAANPAQAPVSGEPYAEDVVIVHNFNNAADATGSRNDLTGTPNFSDGSLIAGGLRMMGVEPISIAAGEDAAWPADPTFTMSLWIRPSALRANAAIAERTASGGGLRLLLDNGLPVLEAGADTPSRVAAEEAVATGSWTHLAVTAAGGTMRLFVNGIEAGTLEASLPEIDGAIVFGATDAPFVGEIDEFRLSGTAESAAAILFAAVNQGASEAATRTLTLGPIESGAAPKAHNETLEHVMLFGDIARNMMFDGWIAVGVCIIMIILGWTVALQKFLYLNSIEKGSREFVQQWKNLSTDLTALDHACATSVRTLGGKIPEEKAAQIQRSPLFQIYSSGAEEIRHRLSTDHGRRNGLSGRSIQAIRAALDAGLVRAHQKLTNNLIFLTVSIAGGPYVGLLGTVVGVMITFALIAKTGEVEVNTIAPGIASALLATTAGLVVAIPALFIYSYLNGRIKNVVAEIKVFIDEFVAKMAEFYPPASESGVPSGMTPQPVETPSPHIDTISDHQPSPVG